MAYITGVGGNVGSQPVEQWSMNTTAELLDVSTTASGGWVDRIVGFKSASATFSIFVDGTTVATVVGTTYAPGAVLSGATFSVGGSGKGYTGNFVVSGVTCTNPAKSPVKVDVTAESSGSITFGTIGS